MIPAFMFILLVLTACSGTNSQDQLERTFRVAFQPIVQTDPALISSDSEVFIANAVYDYLIDVDGKSNPVPRLATGWTISDDFLRYTFNLAASQCINHGNFIREEDNFNPINFWLSLDKVVWVSFKRDSVLRVVSNQFEGASTIKIIGVFDAVLDDPGVIVTEVIEEKWIWFFKGKYHSR
jgi:hypothetical protein